MRNCHFSTVIAIWGKNLSSKRHCVITRSCRTLRTLQNGLNTNNGGSNFATAEVQKIHPENAVNGTKDFDTFWTSQLAALLKRSNRTTSQNVASVSSAATDIREAAIRFDFAQLPSTSNETFRSGTRDSDSPLSVSATLFSNKSWYRKRFRSRFCGQSEHKGRSDYRSSDQSERETRSGRHSPRLLLAVTLWATIKHMTGIEPIKLDDDPIKARIKRAWLMRRYREHDKAVEELHNGLAELQNSQREDVEMARTRILDELANTYLEMNQLEEAEKLFREVLKRLVTLHGRKDKDLDFIGVSLRLADLFGKRGDYVNAEIGFRHCMEKMDEHNRKVRQKYNSVGIKMDDPSSWVGTEITDPLALQGMICEAFAHFLLSIPPKEKGYGRFQESRNYANQASELASEIYGVQGAQTLGVLNNYAIKCMAVHEYETAAKMLRTVIERSQSVKDQETVERLPGYYCNCAEAVFHSGYPEEALVFARKAVYLAQRSGAGPEILNHVKNFLHELEADAKRVAGRAKSHKPASTNSTSNKTTTATESGQESAKKGWF